MSFSQPPYGRIPPQQPQHTNNNRPGFPQRNPYQQAYFYASQPNQQFIPVQTPIQHFPIMSYGQPQGQPQQPVYLPEDNFSSMAQVGITAIQPQTTMRFPQQQQQQQTYTDNKRKKKEQQIPTNTTQQFQTMTTVPPPVINPQLMTAKRPIQPQYTPATISPAQTAIPPPPPPKQAHAVPPPVVPPAPVPPPHVQTAQFVQQQQAQQTQPQTGLDQLNQKTGVPYTFSNGKPPGCFNIIRRGNLPGMIFKQICI